MKDRKIIALGNFDGVHIGHRKILHSASSYADSLGLRSFVWTFSEVLRKGWFLTERDVKNELICQCGIGRILYEEFDNVRDLSPYEFVVHILKKELRADAVFCGENYSFGKNGAGTAEELEKICSEQGIDVFVVPLERIDGEVVSSTAIRGMLSDGDVKRAGLFLGYDYKLRAVVESGKRIGREIGFPTINQRIGRNMAFLRHGVYQTRTLFDGGVYKSVTNLGVRPTVGGDYESVETHILDCDIDLYGRFVDVEFLDFVRDEIKFDGLDDLKKQIQKDIEVRRTERVRS